MQPDYTLSSSTPRRRAAAWFVILAGLILMAVGAATLAAATQTEAATLTTPGQAAGPLFQGGADGAALFQAKCTGCHSIGGGRLVGPDLKDVTQRRSAEWLKSFIANPSAMIATDATAAALQKEYGVTMPTLGLSAAEIDALIAYLGNPGNVAAGGAAAPAVGDPAAGRGIYRGDKALTNGGPPCIACHSVSGASALNGGGLGPDLTHVAGRMGTAGLTAALSTIAFPTMLGPFGASPLTPQEVADLVAFLDQANTSQPESGLVAPGSLSVSALMIFGLGGAGMLLLFGLLLFFWPRQRQSLASALRRQDPARARKA